MRTVDELLATGHYGLVVDIIRSDQMPHSRVVDLVAQYPGIADALRLGRGAHVTLPAACKTDLDAKAQNHR